MIYRLNICFTIHLPQRTSLKMKRLVLTFFFFDLCNTKYIIIPPTKLVRVPTDQSEMLWSVQNVLSWRDKSFRIQNYDSTIKILPHVCRHKFCSYFAFHNQNNKQKKAVVFWIWIMLISIKTPCTDQDIADWSMYNVHTTKYIFLVPLYFLYINYPDSQRLRKFLIILYAHFGN